jgi:hypothetical protein
VLLGCDAETLVAIFAPRSGQKRVNELFRQVTGRRIGRNVIATVAQQDDFMKRVRANGGARTALRGEGYIILGGDYARHRIAARLLGLEVPAAGEIVSARVVIAAEGDPFTAELAGERWRLAASGDVPFK